MNAKHTSLVGLAKSTPVYDKAFTGKLQKKGVSRLQAAEDLLILSQDATPQEGMRAVEQLRDLRSALMTVHKNVRKTSDGNLTKAKERSGELREEGAFKGEEVEPTEVREFDRFNTISSEMRHTAERDVIRFDNKLAPGLTSLSQYMKDLTKFINIAAAVAALPPGPMGVSVGTFAREGLTGTDGDVSKQIATDERVTTMVDDLKLRFEHMETLSPTNLSIEASRDSERYTTHRTEKHSFGSWLGFKEVEVQTHTRSDLLRSGRKSEVRTLEKAPHHPSHPWIPTDALDLYK